MVQDASLEEAGLRPGHGPGQLLQTTPSKLDLESRAAVHQLNQGSGSERTTPEHIQKLGKKLQKEVSHLRSIKR